MKLTIFKLQNKESGFIPLSILTLICVILTSCQPQGSSPGVSSVASEDGIQPSVTQEISTLSPEVTPTISCSPLPEGATWEIKPTSHYDIEVKFSGFSPGEFISETYISVYGNTIYKMVFGPVQLKSDGSLSTHESLVGNPDRPNVHWQVQLKHSKGYSCKEFVMP